uniref:Uncharacterized protein n=1 Tax=Romanomermis culicivorax TaxID=13658 RepID=A0A915IYE3_ROMCU
MKSSAETSGTKVTGTEIAGAEAASAKMTPCQLAGAQTAALKPQHRSGDTETCLAVGLVQSKEEHKVWRKIRWETKGCKSGDSFVQ